MVDPEQSAEQPAPDAARAAIWRRYLRFWGPRADADVDDELAYHIEMRAREHMACGIPEPEARRIATRRLGDLASVRAECIRITSRRERRMARAQLVDAFLHDLRFAWRTLGRQKGWTAVAAVTLALGIGANTAVFSVVNTLLLHPVPYPNADRLAMVYLEPTRRNPAHSEARVLASPPPDLVRLWREDARSFEALEPYATSDQVLRGTDGSLSTVRTAFVLPSFTVLTGTRPLLGRAFTASDVVDGNRVLMLSAPFWRSRYGGDSAIVGRTITLDGKPGTVVGIMPAGYRLPRRGERMSDVWALLDLRENGRSVSVIARVRRDVSLAAAGRELDTIWARSDPAVAAANFAATLIAPSEMVNLRQSLVLLSWAVALVLLLACGNVAHLLLARTAARQRELAIRAALGASRLRIVRQVLTESFLLNAVGLVGGVLVGWLALGALVHLRPEGLSELADARIEFTTLLVTGLLALVTALAVGCLGALKAVRQSAHGAFTAVALGVSQSRRQRRFRSALVVSETAVSTILLVGAALVTRSVLHLHSLDRGFDPRGLYAITFGLPNASYPTAEVRRAFVDNIADRVRRLPGVAAVSVAAVAPPSRNGLLGMIQVEGQPLPDLGTKRLHSYNAVAPNFFRVMGMRLLEGTTPTDTSAGSRETVVNAGFARAYWPGQSAVGKRFRVVYDGAEDWNTVVGVVADASVAGLTQEASAPFFYLPPGNLPEPTLIIRATAGTNPLASVRALVTQADAAIPPPSVFDIATALERDIAGPRFTALLLVAFTVLALILAAVGLYAVMAYAVAQRTREIGIRVALGATRREVAWSVLRQGLSLALAGAVVGLIGARWGTKLLESFLYGVQRTDMLSFVVGAVVLLSISLLACVVPMRRAVSVDPLVAIRSD